MILMLVRECLFEHVFLKSQISSDSELVPENPKDMLLPGNFQAKIEKRDMKVCEPKDNGNCRDVKFKIVAAEPTPAPTTDPTPTPTPAQEK